MVAAALVEHSYVNAEFIDGKIKVIDAVNVGVAIGTDRGLVVPVMRGAAHKDLAAITAELSAFQEKARTLHFAAEDLAGGTFTLSNLGMYGVERFTAIVNPPQSAILAVGRISTDAHRMPDDTIALRPMMSLTLTVDHRCIDGVQATRLLAEVKEFLEQPQLLLA